MTLDRRYREWIERGNLHGVWGLLVGTGFGVFGMTMGLPTMGHSFWIVPIFSVAGFFGAKMLGYTLLTGSGKTAAMVYAPEGSGMYAQTHSHIDTLEARGDYRGAADAWEQVMVSQPLNPWPLIRAGELYARQLNDPQTALIRFSLARDVPGITPELQRYAIQKIVDLHLGPLADPGKAMVELRKLIIGHPGTREAAFARDAIAKLKASQPG